MGILGDEVILVDERDREIGIAGKLQAHVEGRLHRAFSIFILNDRGETLLQRRAMGKYHSSGLWSNACCSHPRPGEPLLAAAQRRLNEELGFSCPLAAGFEFIYWADVGEGLVEHEFDHVLFGSFSGAVEPNRAEVGQWRWASVAEINAELAKHSSAYTPWLRIAWPRVLERLAVSSARS